MDATTFNLQKPVILCCVYIPPEASTFYANRQEQNGITELEYFLMDVMIENTDSDILVIGDLNSRTGVEQDYIMDDNINHIPGADDWYIVDDFNIPRISRDSQTNTFGRTLIQLCRDCGIHILNGRFPGDVDGEFTFISQTGSSVVDLSVQHCD